LKIGGKKLKNFVGRILSRLISNDLAKKINYTGRGDKIAFEKSPLLAIIKGKYTFNFVCKII